MNQVLVINSGEYEFTSFNRAVRAMEEEYGYEGLAWEMVRSSYDFEILVDFLIGDGLYVELIEEEGDY